MAVWFRNHRWYCRRRIPLVRSLERLCGGSFPVWRWWLDCSAVRLWKGDDARQRHQRQALDPAATRPGRAKFKRRGIRSLWERCRQGVCMSGKIPGKIRTTPALEFGQAVQHLHKGHCGAALQALPTLGLLCCSPHMCFLLRLRAWPRMRRVRRQLRWRVELHGRPGGRGGQRRWRWCQGRGPLLGRAQRSRIVSASAVACQHPV